MRTMLACDQLVFLITRCTTFLYTFYELLIPYTLISFIF
jgi:hypothetical protein